MHDSNKIQTAKAQQTKCIDCNQVHCTCEYCEECRKYHARPTWPNCQQWRANN